MNQQTYPPISFTSPHLIRVRLLLGFFIAALLASGISAILLIPEIDLLYGWLGPGTWVQPIWPAFTDWIRFVHEGLHATNQAYPFLLYGTDWLAFAHIVIAIAFIGPLKDPVRNRWVIQFGMITCLLIVPTALIFGALRGIPFYWRLLDCSFGIFGIIPLWLADREINI